MEYLYYTLFLYLAGIGKMCYLWSENRCKTCR